MLIGGVRQHIIIILGAFIITAIAYAADSNPNWPQFHGPNRDNLSTETGLLKTIQWQVKNGPAWTGDRPGSRGTPTIDGERLYHQSPIGNIVCLDAKTGKKIWGFNTLEKFKSKTNTWALAESLLVDGERLICCPGGPQTSMVALNKNNGSVIWAAPSTGDLAGYSSPAHPEDRIGKV